MLFKWALFKFFLEGAETGDGSVCTINHDELMSRLNKLEQEEQAAEKLAHDKVEPIIFHSYCYWHFTIES